MTLEEAKAKLAQLEAEYTEHESKPEWVETRGMEIGAEMIALRESIRVAEKSGAKTLEVREGR